MTTEQIGAIYEQIYGKHYGKSQVSHLMEFAREEIKIGSEGQLEAIILSFTLMPLTFLAEEKKS